jgi:hypothetical protein
LDSDEANRRLAAAAAEEARKERATADAAKKDADKKSLINLFVFFLICLSFFVCLFLSVFSIYLFAFLKKLPSIGRFTISVDR